ncbi:HlyD family secretion protein [Mangrovibacterium diazotrophicum]|uniref:HlyD family secretion protein n=1 Tax=Mangrovibacterium diazotrophicum TaxID=1261403 RepID=A0A419W6Y4_9BACT|nr:HlyD family efflux transporter periplasmic adaptor subunit [Mangrovibacterium diazotrophicum]RKD91215.1 HlyD family secretion protein [Mangrovibacterium diazotrophicum]
MPRHDGHNITRSDEVQEIIGKSPSWLLRSGQTALLIFLLLLVLGSWLFHYPDIIRARVVVLSENPPAHIVARTTGRIDHLLVDDKDTVERGDVIAILENAANYDDVLMLKEALTGVDRFLISFDTIYYKVLTPDYRLGDIQSDYSSFLRLYNNYISFIRLGFYPQKVKSLEQQVRMQRIYYDRLWSQRQILENEYHIAMEQFQRDSVLYKKEVLSLVDYKASESAMLQKKYSFNELRTSLAETQKDIIELEQDVIGAQKEYEDQKQKLQTEIIESNNILKSRLDYWFKAFVLQTPIDGKVTFTNYWSKNQQVKTDEIVFTVVPFHESRIIGRVSLPLLGAGKVKPGQQVNIQFDNFPYMEYGMVKGVVKSISLVPSNDNYIAEIELPQNLETNYHIPLVFSQEMKGDAEIITEDLRLIQRFFNPIKSLLRSKVMD